MLKPGDKAPAFTLKSDTDADVSLSGFLGKHVILFIFPKANTPG
jgi:thioredoxin-dependent peroxiredoxin